MFTVGKPCRYYQVATLPSPASIPANLVKPDHVTYTLTPQVYTDAVLRSVIIGPNANGGTPGLSISMGQLNLLPEGYITAYHNHLVYGHDLPDNYFPIRAEDSMAVHPYAMGAFAILSKLCLGLARANSKSLDAEKKRAGAAYFHWYKRCEYHLRLCIQQYGISPAPTLVLGGTIETYAGVETYNVLYDIDRFNVWKTASLNNTLEALMNHWVTTKTQPPASF